jgi:hypothetical protein
MRPSVLNGPKQLNPPEVVPFYRAAKPIRLPMRRLRRRIAAANTNKGRVDGSGIGVDTVVVKLPMPPAADDVPELVTATPKSRELSPIVHAPALAS